MSQLTMMVVLINSITYTLYLKKWTHTINMTQDECDRLTAVAVPAQTRHAT